MKADIYQSKNLIPMEMLQGSPFDSSDFIFEIKYDGFRCIAYLDDNSTSLKSRNNTDFNSSFPELLQMHTKAKTRCIIDGEIVVFENGISSFRLLQNRSAKKDEFKISLASKTSPVTFVAFDILYLQDNNVQGYPLLERKKILEQVISPNSNIIISRYVNTNGIGLFELAAQRGLEGIVAKRKDSIYTAGTRTRDWVKMKPLPHSEFRKL